MTERRSAVNLGSVLRCRVRVGSEPRVDAELGGNMSLFGPIPRIVMVTSLDGLANIPISQYSNIRMRTELALPNVRPVSRLFKALGDETRVRIVALLTHGELCVCHVEAALQITQPNASRHLAILRAAGIVDTRKVGNWVHYRLAVQTDSGCRSQLRALVLAFSKHELLKRDVEHLLKVRGPLQCE